MQYCERCLHKNVCKLYGLNDCPFFKDDNKYAELQKFYFTYGTDENMPYQGGWSEVYATSEDEAVRKFLNKHGSRYPDEKIINCAMIYPAVEFETTKMYDNGNFGKHCQEVII